MIESIKDLEFDKLDLDSPDLESKVDLIIQEKLGCKLSDLKKSLAVFLNERADELALDLPYIAPYNDYSKLLDEQDGKVAFLKSDLTKEENWILYSIAEDTENKNLIKFTFRTPAIDDGDIVSGLVFTNKNGLIRHSFIRTE